MTNYDWKNDGWQKSGAIIIKLIFDELKIFKDFTLVPEKRWIFFNNFKTLARSVFVDLFTNLVDKIAYNRG